MSENIELRVGEIPTTAQQDVGRGIIRIDATSMSKMGINPGDVIEIEGKRITSALADRAYPSDVGLGIIRMDGLMRANADASMVLKQGQYCRLTSQCYLLMAVLQFA